MKRFTGFIASNFFLALMTLSTPFSTQASIKATGNEFLALLSNPTPITCEASMLETPLYTCPEGFPLNCQNGKCCGDLFSNP